jgi:pimeloyl-ACP methyl ester carboxylesterase
MAERRRLVDVDGARLEVFERDGEAAAVGAGTDVPTLVFLHEGLGSAAQWRDFPARLGERTGCPTLAYSRRGYGRSSAVALPRPLTYMHEEGERVLPALLDACGVRSCVLVGHSDGASIALVHAGTPAARGRVRGLVLEAPHVFVEDLSVASIAAAREAFEHGALREGLAKYHDDPDGAFRGWNRAWLDPGFRTWNLEGYLPAIDVPVLVVQGENDPYGTLAQVEAIERGVAGGAERRVLPACGHAPHRDQPGATLDAMVAFVERVRRTGEAG